VFVPSALVFIWYGVQFGWDQSSSRGDADAATFSSRRSRGLTWLSSWRWFIKDLRLVFADRVSPLTDVKARL
jgi:hypothetical protein